MELPDSVNKLIQQHLGAEALAAQKQHGRGAWFVTRDSKARYILQKDLRAVILGPDVGDLVQMTRAFDPARQVVIIFEAEEDLQIIAIVAIDDPPGD